MRKQYLAFSILLGFSGLANAAPVMGVGILHISNAGYYGLNSICLTAGYAIPTGMFNFSVIPEVRVGTGLSTGTYHGPSTYGSSADVKFRSFYTVDVRGQWDGKHIYLFAAPAYTHAHNSSAANDAFNVGNFGGGLGMGFKFAPGATFEGAWERFGGVDFYRFGFRKRFGR